MLYLKVIFAQKDVYVMPMMVYLVSAVVLCLVMTFLIMIVDILKHFVIVLNENLKKTIENFQENNMSQQIQTLNTTIHLHNKVQKLIKRFSSAFGLTFLVCFLYVIENITVQVYFVYVTIETDNDIEIVQRQIYCFLNIIWTVPMALLHSILGYKCVRTKVEAQKLNFLMESSYLSVRASRQLKDKVMMFYLEKFKYS